MLYASMMEAKYMCITLAAATLIFLCQTLFETTSVSVILFSDIKSQANEY